METVVAVEESEKTRLEGDSAILIACSESSKQIADPVVYKLARVGGDGRLIPATDDEVMEVEDLLDDKSSVHFVLDTGQSQTATCTSNDDTFDQEFMPIDCEGLLKFDDPSTQGERSDALVETTVDLGKLNSHFEEITRSVSNPVGEPSTSTTSGSWKPDFSKLKGEVCLDNLSVRELHATFKATFGRETSVKDKQWLKRRISMGLSNSCDVSTTTFIIENDTVKKKGKLEDSNNNNNDDDEDVEFNDDNMLISHTIQMEDHFSGSSSKSDTFKNHNNNIGSEDENQQGSKRVRKPTKRYIEEVYELEEYSGRSVSSVKNSGSGPRARVRPVNNIQPVRRPLVTRQDSLGGSGVEIPYVSRIRRGRPRENYMALMKFESCGMGNTPRLEKKVHDPQSDNEIENQEVKATPVIEEVEGGENEEYSGHMDDTYGGDGDSDDDNNNNNDSNNNNNILLTSVPTAKGGMRRKHHRPWTLSEVVKLVEGVSRYGAGRWSEIKRISFATCSHRTPVDLKDKWRNLLRASFAQLPADKGVGNSKKQSSIPIPAPILLRVRELAEMQSQVSPGVKFSSRSVNDIRSGFL